MWILKLREQNHHRKQTVWNWTYKQQHTKQSKAEILFLKNSQQEIVSQLSYT